MPSSLSLLSLATGLLLATAARALDNGMDMTMDGAMVMASGQMLPYLHFTPGDILWFYGWVPSSTGSMVGACIGLFLLGLLDRWISACRGMMEAHWSKRAQIIQADRLNRVHTTEKSSSTFPGRLRDVATMRNGPPFILAHDVSRGILHAVQAALHFAMMLAVMTFQVGFILSIVIGLGVGETLFGRFASHAGHH